MFVDGLIDRADYEDAKDQVLSCLLGSPSGMLPEPGLLPMPLLRSPHQTAMRHLEVSPGPYRFEQTVGQDASTASVDSETAETVVGARQRVHAQLTASDALSEHPGRTAGSPAVATRLSYSNGHGHTKPPSSAASRQSVAREPLRIPASTDRASQPSTGTSQRSDRHIGPHAADAEVRRQARRALTDEAMSAAAFHGLFPTTPLRAFGTPRRRSRQEGWRLWRRRK